MTPAERVAIREAIAKLEGLLEAEGCGPTVECRCVDPNYCYCGMPGPEPTKREFTAADVMPGDW